MKIQPDGTVHLDKGEVVPAFCPCGYIYQPEAGSEVSDCPKCHRVNVHGVLPDVHLTDRADAA